MKLWLVKTEKNGYDEFSGFVIRAKNETEARFIAQTKASWGEAADYRGRQDFQDPEYATCTHITISGQSEIILDAFDAG